MLLLLFNFQDLQMPNQFFYINCIQLCKFTESDSELEHVTSYEFFSSWFMDNFSPNYTYISKLLQKGSWKGVQ